MTELILSVTMDVSLSSHLERRKAKVFRGKLDARHSRIANRCRQTKLSVPKMKKEWTRSPTTVPGRNNGQPSISAISREETEETRTRGVRRYRKLSNLSILPERRGLRWDLSRGDFRISREENPGCLPSERREPPRRRSRHSSPVY